MWLCLPDEIRQLERNISRSDGRNFGFAMHSRKDKKDDEDGGMSGNKWAGERSSVLQEARVFTKSPVDPKKSSQVGSARK